VAHEQSIWPGAICLLYERNQLVAEERAECIRATAARRKAVIHLGSRRRCQIVRPAALVSAHDPDHEHVRHVVHTRQKCLDAARVPEVRFGVEQVENRIMLGAAIVSHRFCDQQRLDSFKSFDSSRDRFADDHRPARLLGRHSAYRDMRHTEKGKNSKESVSHLKHPSACADDLGRFYLFTTVEES
jgi:hypothetical protein